MTTLLEDTLPAGSRLSADADVAMTDEAATEDQAATAAPSAAPISDDSAEASTLTDDRVVHPLDNALASAPPGLEPALFAAVPGPSPQPSARDSAQPPVVAAAASPPTSLSMPSTPFPVHTHFTEPSVVNGDMDSSSSSDDEEVQLQQARTNRDGGGGGGSGSRAAGGRLRRHISVDDDAEGATAEQPASQSATVKPEPTDLTKSDNRRQSGAQLDHPVRVCLSVLAPACTHVVCFLSLLGCPICPDCMRSEEEDEEEESEEEEEEKSEDQLADEAYARALLRFINTKRKHGKVNIISHARKRKSYV